jgi:hypothetical protein
MRKIAVIFIAASICSGGGTGVSLAADNYYSCVREAVSRCQYIRDEWESCGDLYVDVADMCRSLYPRKSHR